MTPAHALQQGDNDFVAFQGTGFRLGTDPSILCRGQSGIFDEDVQALDDDRMSTTDEVPCGQPNPHVDDVDERPVFSARWPGRHRDQGVPDPGSQDMNSFLMSQPNPHTIAQNLKTETPENWLFLASAWAADEKCNVQPELREQIEAMQMSGAILLSSVKADNFGLASMAKCAEFTAEASRLQGVMNRVYMFAESGKQNMEDPAVDKCDEDDSLDEMELFSPSKKRSGNGASGHGRKRLRQKAPPIVE